MSQRDKGRNKRQRPRDKKKGRGEDNTGEGRIFALEGQKTTSGWRGTEEPDRRDPEANGSL